MRISENYKSQSMNGIISSPEKKPDTILVALHGIGSNEKDLVPVAEEIAPDSLIISLQSPIPIGTDAYSFFHVQFTPGGNIHDRENVQMNFSLLENELIAISEYYKIPLQNISVLGFSQGAIMTMGLLLKSSLKLGHYLCFSGRTLPEFAEYALMNPMTGAKRKIFLAHGLQDNVLSLENARRSKEILEQVNADLTYKEFNGGHGITEPILIEVRNWLRTH